MNNRALFDELMDELNTQSLARFNFNIFNLNTYAAMVESAKLTTNMQKDIKQHGKNPNGFGQFFETLEVGKKYKICLFSNRRTNLHHRRISSN
ncbi:TPA: hypothetical protein R8930_001170 [Campylobacter jejuni]|nr:hypothetical protein [Campylobacter jejuni]MDN2896842.1 hypothetical protein [Campylobacter jejuni]HEF3156009.1 hypothetical protein [Campylobacter jejuni]